LGNVTYPTQLSISNDIIDEYFLKEAHISAVRLTDIFGMLQEDRQEEFVETSRQLMLDYIREYLGLV